MSTINWDDDVKKYRAKRMSVSGHNMQPQPFQKPIQPAMIAIVDTQDDDEFSDDDSDDDLRTSSDSHASLVPTASSYGGPNKSNSSIPIGLDFAADLPTPAMTDETLSTPRSISSNTPDQSTTSLSPQKIPSSRTEDFDDDDLNQGHWMELQGVHDRDFRLYINTKTNQTTHVRPVGFVPPASRHNLPTATELLNVSVSGESPEEKVQYGLQHIHRYIDQQLIPHTSKINDTIDEELKRIRTLIDKLQGTIAIQKTPKSGSTLAFLLGTDTYQWDFNAASSLVKVNYYRAAATLKTNHEKFQFNTWHLPQYFSEQPLLATCQKKTVIVHLPSSETESLPPHRPRRTVIEVKIDDTTDFHLTQCVNILYDKATNASNFVFKIVGHQEFIDHGHLFWAYAHVRKAIRDNAELEVLLLRRPEPLQLTAQQEEESQLIIENYSAQIDRNVLNNVLEKDTYADLTNITNMSYEQMMNLTHIPISALNIPFNVQIVGIDNISLDTLPRWSSDMASIFIRVVLFHGIVELPFQIETIPADICETILLKENLSGGPLSLLSLLPRETRIGYMLYGRMKDEDPKNDVQLGCVVNQIINEHGELINGPVAHSIWGFPASSDGKKVGTKRDRDPFFMYRCTNWDNLTERIAKCVIRVQYPTFVLPVVSPLVTRYYEPNTRMVGAELRKTLDKTQSQTLLRILHSDPLFELTPEHKQLLWNSRHYLVDTASALPKLLLCVDWTRQDYRNEMHRLLKIWALPANSIEAIGLLDVRYPDYRVREYAVNALRLLNDEDLQLYLLQLVQCLKYEPYHDSPLSRFLIERAIKSPYQVGHTFFWHLKAEVHDPTICERFMLILEELLTHIGRFTEDLYKQVMAVTQLQKVAEHVWRMKREFGYSDEETTIHYHQKLQELNEQFFLPQGKFQIPLNPVIEGTQLIVEKCKFMSSKMVPLWLVFKNADPAAPPIYLIFKSGDDLRQDLLTLQILRIMDRMWLQQGLDMRLKPYNVIATGVNEIGEGVGMIEVVLNSTTTSDIQVKYGGGARGALRLEPIDLYLRQHNNDPTSYTTAVSNFIQSCAGYCVATFVLGIGDRHNGNIMVTKSGHLFHIDFGHFLGNFKKKFGLNRERAAFVFTPEMAYVMGGKDYKKSDKFKQFKQMCTKSFKVLRQNVALLEYLFVLMIAAGMPELNVDSDILYLQGKLRFDLDVKSAAKELQIELRKALDSTSRRLDNYLHNLKHG